MWFIFTVTYRCECPKRQVLAFMLLYVPRGGYTTINIAGFWIQQGKTLHLIYTGEVWNC